MTLFILIFPIYHLIIDPIYADERAIEGNFSSLILSTFLYLRGKTEYMYILASLQACSFVVKKLRMVWT